MMRGRQALEIHTKNEKVMMILMSLTACSCSLKSQRGELFWGSVIKVLWSSLQQANHNPQCRCSLLLIHLLYANGILLVFGFQVIRSIS